MPRRPSPHHDVGRNRLAPVLVAAMIEQTSAATAAPTVQIASATPTCAPPGASVRDTRGVQAGLCLNFLPPRTVLRQDWSVDRRFLGRVRLADRPRRRSRALSCVLLRYLGQGELASVPCTVTQRWRVLAVPGSESAGAPTEGNAEIRE
jgi:hypothetical protein